MPSDLQEFHQEFFQDVLASADVSGTWAEDAFFERFCEHLVAAGELETADRTLHAPVRGRLRVDGYGGDPLDSDGVLSLIIADFSQSQAVDTLTATEMEATFKRLENFLTKALDRRFRSELDESSPVFGLSDLIAQRWSSVSKVRMFLISNRVLSSRVDGKDADSIGAVPVTYSVWDLGRLHRFVGSGGRPDIFVDLETEFGGALPALPAHLEQTEYQAFLVVVPGAQLAAIYDKWGSRLLEQNVRVFLQARGSVNSGIRTTIESTPEMFFAYNNGITATADEIETGAGPRGLVIRSVRNLQIVNGGQTTASIHAASRRAVDLSRVFVQMKLSIIEPTLAPTVVPKISEFANSQNRVNAADFFSNTAFHIRFEEFSRRLFAPSPDGAFRESKWFYERARGQHQDARARLTDAQRKKFDLEYPKSQVITKEALAKYVFPWRGHPDIVSKGSQKNFGEFAKTIGVEWSKNSDIFNEAFYRQTIAQAIVFGETEKIVSEQPWYQGGGIRSRVVPYAIAKLAHDAAVRGRFVDLEAVWRQQAVPAPLRSALAIASTAVYGVITGSAESANHLEFAKQQVCWSRVQRLEVAWPTGWLNSLLSSDDVGGAKRSAAKEQKLLNELETYLAVVDAGHEFWRSAREWGAVRGLLSSSESGILEAASNPRKVITEKQAFRALETLVRLQAEGFQGRLKHQT